MLFLVRMVNLLVLLGCLCTGLLLLPFHFPPQLTLKSSFSRCLMIVRRAS